MKKKTIRKTKLRVITALLLSLPVCTMAQEGLFQRGTASNIDKSPMLLRNGESATSLTNQGFGNPNGSDLTNQTFGVPLGSGLFIMLMASAGYATLKTNKKNNKTGKGE